MIIICQFMYINHTINYVFKYLLLVHLMIIICQFTYINHIINYVFKHLLLVHMHFEIMQCILKIADAFTQFFCIMSHPCGYKRKIRRMPVIHDKDVLASDVIKKKTIKTFF